MTELTTDEQIATLRKQIALLRQQIRWAANAEDRHALWPQLAALYEQLATVQDVPS